MANERKRYTVTELAGPRVAGLIVQQGDTLMLTAEEAEYELGQGTIVLEGTELHPSFKKPQAAPAEARKKASSKAD